MHHACCASHRTLSLRERKGKTSPYKNSKAVKGSIDKTASKAAINAAIPALLNGAGLASVGATVGTALVTQAAVPAIMDGITKGNINLTASGTGAAGGYFISGFFTKSPLLRILAALGGGYISNQFYNLAIHPVNPNSQIELASRGHEGKTLTPEEYSEIINSREYRQIEIPTYRFAHKYSKLFGNPSTDFYMMLHGIPGQGKSHWAAKFADYFNKNHGRVLYYAAEQNGISKSFQDIQNKLKTSFDVHLHPERLTRETMINHFNSYNLIVIDSVNALKLSDKDIKLIRDNSSASVLVILQSNKDGDFKGTQSWAHDADIAIKMESREPIIEKSRFGGGDDPTIPMGRVVNL